MSAGRPPGSTNQNANQLRAMILAALSAKGGQVWLETQMDENPTAMLTLLGKIMPTQLTSDPDAPFAIQLIQRQVVDAKD